MIRLMVLALATVVSFAARGALAEDSSPTSKAEEAFLAGRVLLKDRRYPEACAKFQESEAQDPASGTLLALAYCQELSGLLATSWASYAAAAQLAEREGQSDRRAAATERVQALGQRFSTLLVSVPAELLALPGFQLQRDGAELERASFGIPLAMDGGSHVFSASAPGRIPWTSTVTLSVEGDHKTLVLPVLDSMLPEPAPVVTQAPVRPLLAPPASESEGPAANVGLKRASLALAAGSFVALGLGTAFALSAKSKKDESNANDHCDNTGCDSRGSELRRDALSAARFSTWTFVGGAALAACSITLYLEAARSPADRRRATQIQANVALGEPRVFLSGSF